MPIESRAPPHPPSLGFASARAPSPTAEVGYTRLRPLKNWQNSGKPEFCWERASEFVARLRFFTAGKLQRSRGAVSARVFLRFPPPKQGAGGVDPRKMRGGRRANRRIQSVCARGRTLLAQTAQACLRDRAAPLGAPSRRFLSLVPQLPVGAQGGPISFPLIRAASAALRPRARPAFEGSRSSCRRAGGQGLPGAWRAVHARGRRPEPHEPAQPVHGPSGGSGA